MTASAPSRVIVEAAARLHLGFIDLNGGAGRLFGSIGIGLERPRHVVEVRRTACDEIDGEVAPDIARITRALGDAWQPGPLGVRVLERIPRHQGLGSGTQRDLALGCALSRLSGVELSASEIAARVGRGRRSGVGIATFEAGGLVVDAGVPCEARRSGAAGSPDRVPPVIFQRALPDDWQFVLASPSGEQGVHGPHEEAIFRDLVPMSDAVAGRISQLVLMKLLPSVVADRIDEFGGAITEIQDLLGREFAPHQGGPYASECGRAIADFARCHGAAGVGQSSWGPTVFAVVRGAAAALDLIDGIRSFAGERTVELWHTRASVRGAVVRTGS